MVLRLSKKKAIVRQFMGAVRRMSLSYFHILSPPERILGFSKLNGRIPWGNIADHPSNHLSKNSRPDTDHKLMEPSHMKAKGVDDWLRHWMKLQQKGKQPLILKALSDPEGSPSVKSRKDRKGKCKQRDSDDDSEADEVNDGGTPDNSKGKKTCHKGKDDFEDVDDDSGSDNQPMPDGADAPNLPFAPNSTAKTKETHYKFLTSLSEDKNYLLLIRLLLAAKVGPTLFFGH